MVADCRSSIRASSLIKPIDHNHKIFSFDFLKRNVECVPKSFCQCCIVIGTKGEGMGLFEGLIKVDVTYLNIQEL